MFKIQPLENRTLLTAGALDSAFGANGLLTTDFTGVTESTAASTVTLPDRRIIAVGTVASRQLVLARFLPTGEIDASFGHNGTITTHFGGFTRGVEILRLSDGKLLVAGTVDRRLFVARFNASGHIDTTFATQGRWISTQDQFDDRALSLRLRTDGKIIAAAGTTETGLTQPAVLVVRLTSSGQLDSSFAANGQLQLDFGNTDVFAGVELLPDNRIVIAGGYKFGPATAPSAIALYRFTADGATDTTFGNKGSVVGNIFGSNDLVDFALDATGGIIILNRASLGFSLARFRADGVFDRSFAGGQRLRHVNVVSPVNGSRVDSTSLRITPEGKLLVETNVGIGSRSTTSGLVLVRLSASGNVDTRYATNGFARLPLAPDAAARTFSLQPDGSALLAGQSSADMLLARLSANGDPVSAWSGDGVTTLAVIGPSSDSARSAVVTADGKIVVAGNTLNRGTRPALARYAHDGSLDPTFGIDGRLTLNLFSGDHGINAIQSLPDGKLLVVVEEAYKSAVVVRLNADGSIDTSFADDGRLTLSRAAHGLLLLADGDFLVVCKYPQATLFRYHANGDLDTSFATSGQLALPDFSPSIPASILQKPDGRILIAGAAESQSLYGGLYSVWQINPDGTLDTSFGVEGKTIINFLGFSSQMTLQADGRILIAGLKSYAAGSDFAILRLTSTGALDPSFGNGGIVVTGFPPDFPQDWNIPTNAATTITLQPDGRILVAGFNDGTATDGAVTSATRDWALARYNPDGSLDYSFGDRGKVGLSFGRDDTPVAAFFRNGRLLIAGTGQPNPTDSDFALAQFTLDDPNPINASLVNGLLKITGTPAADSIRLEYHSDRLFITGYPTSFPLSAFSAIQIEALAGNDLLDASQSPVPVTLLGGDGDDSLLGGGYNDLLQGDSGHDTLFGGKGNDTLHGKAGNDYLNPGPGHDTVFADEGNDQIFARDSQQDLLNGGPGHDRATHDPADQLHDIESLLP